MSYYNPFYLFFQGGICHSERSEEPLQPCAATACYGSYHSCFVRSFAAMSRLWPEVRLVENGWRGALKQQ